MMMSPPRTPDTPDTPDTGTPQKKPAETQADTKSVDQKSGQSGDHNTKSRTEAVPDHGAGDKDASQYHHR
jgi:hypothetical protein